MELKAHDQPAAGVGAVHIVAPSEIAASLLAPGSVGTLLVP